MKEELQGKLVEILTSIQTAAGKASDFAMEQLPDVAQSYLAYGRAWASFEVFIVAGLLIAAVFCNYLFVRWMKRSDTWEMSPLLVLTGAVGLGLGIWFMAAVHSAFLVWFAPKVWLLKEIAALVK